LPHPQFFQNPDEDSKNVMEGGSASWRGFIGRFLMSENFIAHDPTLEPLMIKAQEI